MNDVVDAIVVGGGPAGLSAAINLKTRGKSVRVFSNSENYLSKAEMVDNYLGMYNFSGKDMMNKFIEHAKNMDVHIEESKVVNILPLGDSFMVNINGEITQSKKIILAMGVTNTKQLPGEGVLLGKGVSYCATCDGMLYRNKKAVVWDQSKDAVEEANYLQSIGVNVTFVSKKPRDKHLNDSIEYKQGTIKELVGEDNLETVVVGDEKINTNAAFLLREAVAPSALIDGLDMDGNFIKVDRNMRTNIDGVYAAGDITGKPLQVSKAVGEGLIAALDAASQIDNKEEI